jgi:hypothetical protein
LYAEYWVLSADTVAARAMACPYNLQLIIILVTLWLYTGAWLLYRICALLRFKTGCCWSVTSVSLWSIVCGILSAFSGYRSNACNCMSIQSAADNNISNIMIVYRSLITLSDMCAFTFQDWLLLIADIRLVVIDCMRNTECFQRIP